MPALEAHVHEVAQWLDGRGVQPRPFIVQDFGKDLMAALNDYASKTDEKPQYTHEDQLDYHSSNLLNQLAKIELFADGNYNHVSEENVVQYQAVQQCLVMAGKMAFSLSKELGDVDDPLTESLRQISEQTNSLMHEYTETNAKAVCAACKSLAEIEPHLRDLQRPVTPVADKEHDAAAAGPAIPEKRRRSASPPAESAVKMGAAFAAIAAGKVPPASSAPTPLTDNNPVQAPRTPTSGMPATKKTTPNVQGK